jgi:hypothetical protein
MDEDRSKRGTDPNKSASSEQGQIACKCRRNRLPSRTIAPDGIGNGHSMAQSWCNMESAASSSRIKISLKSRFHRRSQAASQRNPGNIMAKQLHYGSTAKVFHWLIVALLIVQFPLGWFMPDIHRGMKPGDAMTFHISFGITILALIVLRFSGASPIPSRRQVRLRPSSS